MARKCYISYKREDQHYKETIQKLGIDMIDKSLDNAIDSTNDDYIMSVIRRDYLSDSTVTIHLIGQYGAEIRGLQEQRFIKRELQASLYNREGNSKNGILGIVLPEMMPRIVTGEYRCSTCGSTHNGIMLNDYTTIKEFYCNYYIYDKCSHTED